MGKGRKPLPTEVKRLQGTLKPYRITDHINTAALAGVPPCPKDFTDQEKKLWDSVTAFLHSNKILQDIGLPNVVSWCRFMHRHLEAEVWIAEHGAVYFNTDREGNTIPKTHPYHRISIESSQQAQRLGAEFGLTPSSQTKIVASLGYLKDDPNDEDFT